MLMESSISQKTRNSFKKLIRGVGLNFHNILHYDLLIDHLLVLATHQAFKTMRKPGKYNYDVEDGEIDLSKYNASLTS